MATYQQYLGTIVIDANSKDFTVSSASGAWSNAIALTVGRYYIDTLCDHIQTLLRARADADGDETCAYSGTTGKVTIAFPTGVGDEQILWVDTNIRDYLGYGATQTDFSSGSVTATNTPIAVWRPSRELALYPGDLTLWWLPRSTSMVMVAPDGSTYSAQGSKLSDGEFSYRYLTDDEVLATSTTGYETLQSFWENVVHPGYPLKAFPDRTAATSYYCIMLPADADTGEPVEIGSFAGMTGRELQQYNGLWSLSFKLVEYN